MVTVSESSANHTPRSANYALDYSIMHLDYSIMHLVMPITPEQTISTKTYSQ